jgi:hypothetical protein
VCGNNNNVIIQVYLSIFLIKIDNLISIEYVNYTKMDKLHLDELQIIDIVTKNPLLLPYVEQNEKLCTIAVKINTNCFTPLHI